MLEGERSDLVAVALRATGLVGAGRANAAREHRSVRVVAIGTGHRAFRQAVSIGLLKAGPYIRVAGSALLVDRRGFSGDQILPAVLVYGVATDAAHLVLGMTAINAGAMSRGILVAGEADAVRRRGGELCGLRNLSGLGGLSVVASQSVAGFAGEAGPAAFLFDLNCLVRSLLKCVVDVFVT